MDLLLRTSHARSEGYGLGEGGDLSGAFLWGLNEIRVRDPDIFDSGRSLFQILHRLFKVFV